MIEMTPEESPALPVREVWNWLYGKWAARGVRVSGRAGENKNKKTQRAQGAQAHRVGLWGVSNSLSVVVVQPGARNAYI